LDVFVLSTIASFCLSYIMSEKKIE